MMSVCGKNKMCKEDCKKKAKLMVLKYKSI